MELRSHSHLHHIQAIKSGLVVKLQNFDTKGPPLKFKKIEDIYNAGEDNIHNLVPAIQLRDDIESSPFKSIGVKIEIPSSTLKEINTTKSDPEASAHIRINGGGEREDDLDDLSFESMTLKQFQERRKANKRKHFSYADSIEETIGTLLSAKEEDPNFAEDQCDLEEPLSIWKAKLSKNIKREKKCSRSPASSSAQNVMCIVNYQQNICELDFVQNEDCPASASVKTEEPGYSVCQDMLYFTSDSALSCSEEVDPSRTASNEVPETTDEHILETVMSLHSRTEPHCCVINEVEDIKPELDIGVSGWEVVKVDSPEIIKYDLPDLSEFDTDGCIIYPLLCDVSEPLSPLRDDSSDMYDELENSSAKQIIPWESNSYNQIQVPEMISEPISYTEVLSCPGREFNCCLVKEASYKCMEDIHSKLPGRFADWEIVKVDSPELTNYQCSESGSPPPSSEGYAIYSPSSDVFLGSTSPTKGHTSDMQDSFENDSSECKMSWQISSYSQIQLPDVSNDNGLRFLEGRGCEVLFRNSNKDDWADNLKNNEISPSSDCGLLWNPNSRLSADRCLTSVSDYLPSARKQSPSATHEADAVKNRCSSVSHSCDSLDELMSSPRLQGYHRTKLKYYPERLLANRKSISPTSQERLCRALESTVLDDNEHYKSRGKLYFGKQINHRILRAEGLEQLWRAGVATNPKQSMRRPKYEKKGSPPKGILKSPRLFRSNSHVSPGCTSIQHCSQNVIAFSQRQMRDTESLAIKLSKELNSMKAIMKETLLLGGSTAPTLKQNAAKMRLAIENATRAEETARRWLSMMERDCTRFCKIMRLTEDDCAASENVIRKERKITFADENGGKLCHVKVFKDDMAYVLECGSEKQIVMVD